MRSGHRYWEGKQFELDIAPGLTVGEYAAQPCRAAYSMLGIGADGPEVRYRTAMKAPCMPHGVCFSMLPS